MAMIDSFAVFVISGILTLAGAIKKARKEHFAMPNRYYCKKCGEPHQSITNMYCPTCHAQGQKEPTFSKIVQKLIIKEWP